MLSFIKPFWKNKNKSKHNYLLDLIMHLIIVLKPGFDKANYEHDNDQFLKTKALFSLSQLRPRQRLISSQSKAINLKDDCFVFVLW